MANKMLTRVRELFDDEEKKLKVMASTYRSGINIKFGKAHYDFLGQMTYNTSDGQDWTKGAIMFDFPSYKPTVGDKKRYNEEFCTPTAVFCCFPVAWPLFCPIFYFAATYGRTNRALMQTSISPIRW